MLETTTADYLFEFDSVRSNDLNYDNIALKKLLHVLVVEQKNVVFSLNQIADSQIFFRTYQIAESHKDEDGGNFLIRLFEEGRLMVSCFGDIRNAKEYVLNSLDKLIKSREGTDGFIFSAIDHKKIEALFAMDPVILVRFLRLMKRALVINDISLLDKLNEKEKEKYEVTDLANAEPAEKFDRILVMDFMEEMGAEHKWVSCFCEDVRDYICMLIDINSAIFRGIVSKKFTEAEREQYNQVSSGNSMSDEVQMLLENTQLRVLIGEAAVAKLNEVLAVREFITRSDIRTELDKACKDDWELKLYAYAVTDWAYNNLIYRNIFQTGHDFNLPEFREYCERKRTSAILEPERDCAESRTELLKDKRLGFLSVVYKVSDGLYDIAERHRHWTFRGLKAAYRISFWGRAIFKFILGSGFVIVLGFLSNFLDIGFLKKINLGVWFIALLGITLVVEYFSGLITDRIQYNGLDGIIKKVNTALMERRLFRWIRE